MARGSDFHSSLVTGVKIVLPLIALGLLSTVFLISRKVDPSKSLPVAQFDVRQRARDAGATNPSFAGVTVQGDQVRIDAASARPDADTPKVLHVQDVAARLNLVSGAEITIDSHKARMDQESLTLRFEGDVHIVTSSGYDIRTQSLSARIDRLFAASPGRITGTGVLGELTAGRMVLDKPDGTGAQMLFTDGVKLVYNPRTTKE